MGCGKTNVEIEFQPRPGESIPGSESSGRKWRSITSPIRRVSWRHGSWRPVSGFTSTIAVPWASTARASFERLSEEDEVLDETLSAGTMSSWKTQSSTPVIAAVCFSGISDMARVVLQWPQGFLHRGGHLFSQRAGRSGHPLEPQRPELPGNDFSTDLITTRLGYSFTTNMFLSALIQYSSREGDIASTSASI